MKRVITYGIYDLLHYEHINLLRHARHLYDYLALTLSTDEFNTINKNTYFCYDDRKRILEAIRYVDLVIPEFSWEQKRVDIVKYSINIFLIGND